MSKTKLKKPISVGTQWTHKKQNMVCEVSAIWINSQAQAVIESVDDDGEIGIDSISSFVDNYRLKRADHE